MDRSWRRRAFGAIYFGAPDNVQEGFNEAGLAYDANGLPPFPVRAHDGTMPGPGEYALYPIAILRECATVDEVIKWAEEHRWHSSMHDQMHFADASGDAVIISAGADGRLAYTRKPDGDSYLVSTNFNVANPQNGNRPSWRYERAGRLASEMLRSGTVLRDRVASIMDAVHIENQRLFTDYTVVADLVRGKIAGYFMFQYDTPIKLDLRAELAKGPLHTTLRGIFPESTVSRAAAALHRLAANTRTWTIISIVWAATVLVCVVLWFLLPKVFEGRGTSLFATAVLGPIGLLAGVLRHRSTGGEQRRLVDTSKRRHSWAAALSDAVRDAASIVLPLAVGALLMVTTPSIGNSPVLPLLFLIIAPAVFAWFAVRAPALSASSRLGFGRSVVRSAAPSIFTSSVMVAIMPPELLPFTLYLAGKLESFYTLALAVWMIGVVVCIVGIFFLTLLYRGMKISNNEARPRRFGIATLMVLAGVVPLMGAVYLTSRMVYWFAPLIEGAPGLR